MRSCHRSRVQLPSRLGCQQLGTCWSTTRLVPDTTATGDTFDLFDGDLLSVQFNYLCDGTNVQMNGADSDPLQRIFWTLLHLEHGYLDHRSGVVGAVHGRASVGMGRLSYYFIHNADARARRRRATLHQRRSGGVQQRSDER